MSPRRKAKEEPSTYDASLSLFTSGMWVELSACQASKYGKIVDTDVQVIAWEIMHCAAEIWRTLRQRIRKEKISVDDQENIRGRLEFVLPQPNEQSRGKKQMWIDISHKCIGAVLETFPTQENFQLPSMITERVADLMPDEFRGFVNPEIEIRRNMYKNILATHGNNFWRFSYQAHAMSPGKETHQQSQIISEMTAQLRGALYEGGKAVLALAGSDPWKAINKEYADCKNPKKKASAQQKRATAGQKKRVTKRKKRQTSRKKKPR